MWLLYVVGGAAGWVLFLLLLWRCHKQHHWSRYPFFSTYLIYTAVRYVAIQLAQGRNDHFYAILYWLSDLPAVLLRFFVALEVLRNLFPAGTVVREVANRFLLGVLALLAVAFYFLPNPRLGFFIDFERKVGLMVVCWLVVILLLARLYDRPVTKNIWGMAVGMGLYVSVAVANLSAYDLKSSFYETWGVLTGYSFVVMQLIWLWALWTYTPAPQLQPVSGTVLDAAQSNWQQSWRKLSAAIRKGLGR